MATSLAELLDELDAFTARMEPAADAVGALRGAAVTLTRLTDDGVGERPAPMPAVPSPCGSNGPRTLGRDPLNRAGQVAALIADAAGTSTNNWAATSGGPSPSR